MNEGFITSLTAGLRCAERLLRGVAVTTDFLGSMCSFCHMDRTEGGGMSELAFPAMVVGVVLTAPAGAAIV